MTQLIGVSKNYHFSNNGRHYKIAIKTFIDRDNVYYYTAVTYIRTDMNYWLQLECKPISKEPTLEDIIAFLK